MDPPVSPSSSGPAEADEAVDAAASSTQGSRPAAVTADPVMAVDDDDDDVAVERASAEVITATTSSSSSNTTNMHTEDGLNCYANAGAGNTVWSSTSTAAAATDGSEDNSRFTLLVPADSADGGNADSFPMDLVPGDQTSPPSSTVNNNSLLANFDDNEMANDGGPSSVEAQADPNDLDLSNQSLPDLDLPDMGPITNTQYLLSHLPSTTTEGKSEQETGSNPLNSAGGDSGAAAAAAAANSANTASDLSFLDYLTPHGPLPQHVQSGPGDTKSDTAVAGVCGLRNLANTCYMNSGLQCLFATPPVANFFLNYVAPPEEKVAAESGQESSAAAASAVDSAPSSADLSKMKERLVSQFAPLLKNVWQGDYEALRPSSFKDVLGEMHTQFRGSQQHDCQEFLTLLLDTVHVELNAEGSVPGSGKPQNNRHGSSDCGTSMELHTSHSVDKEEESGKRMVTWLRSANGEQDELAAGPGSRLNGKKGPVAALAGHVGSTGDMDGTESRESASPKSFDSHSSLDDKVPESIRHRPLPADVKPFNHDDLLNGRDVEGHASVDESSSGGAGGGAGDTLDVDDDMDDDTMDSTASSQPTSNLVTPDSLLKAKHVVGVRFNEAEAVVAGASSAAPTPEAHGEQNNEREVSINDYIKDSKTLNVNVLAKKEDEHMNNEINFDSDKFSKHHDNPRPRETIENLNLTESQLFEKKSSSSSCHNNKRFKSTNLTSGGANAPCEEGNGEAQARRLEDGEETNGRDKTRQEFEEFNGIKRMRLDSSEKEKNVQLEMERHQQQHEHNRQFDEEEEELLAEESSSAGSAASAANANASALMLGGSGASAAAVFGCAGGVGGSSGGPQLPPSSGGGDPNRLKQAIEAGRYWEKHMAANDTIIANTFQGQFKNTVICSVCHYVSVNFEPFMYLPVPLPNGLARQLEVTLVSTRYDVKTYLLNLTQTDTAKDMRYKLAELVLQTDTIQYGGQERMDVDEAAPAKAVDVKAVEEMSSRLQVVEVFDSHISRQVEDWCQIKHLKDDRAIYIIDVINVDGARQEEQQAEVVCGPAVSSSNETVFGPAENSEQLFDDLVRGKGDGDSKPTTTTNTTTNTASCEGASVLPDSGGDRTEGSEAEAVASPGSSMSLCSSGVKEHQGEGEGNVTSSSNDNANSCEESSQPARCKTPSPPKEPVHITLSPPAPPPAPAVPETIEFQSCVICMEEFPPSGVRQHNSCRCTMCQPCIERSVEHHESDKEMPHGFIRCPGCRDNVDPSSEFVCMEDVGKSKPKLRHFTLPVIMRYEEDVTNQGGGDDNNVTTSSSTNHSKRFVPFGYPSLIRLPNQIVGRRLHELLEPLLKIPQNYDLVLCDSQGKNCSRCLLFTSDCRDGGCVRIPCDDEEVLLQTNDHIAVSYRDIDLSVLRAVYMADRDASMDQERLRDVLKLEECLEAFSENEKMDGNNLWYCTMCRKRQEATKTLTIWKLPDFLIVYLKRFVFIKNSVKLEKPVDFALSNLDLTPYLSGPLQADNPPMFDLYACVNHYGSVGGGHYTAYTKHPPTQRWNYFDDCSVTENRQPAEGSNRTSDQAAGYVLFYARKGASANYQLPNPVKIPRPVPTSSPDLNKPLLSPSSSAFTLPCDRDRDQAANDEGSPPPPSSFTMPADQAGRDPASDSADKTSAKDAGEEMASGEDESAQPDLNRLIRSLNTPPPTC